MTPFEAFQKHILGKSIRPDLTYLRTISYKAYVHIPSPRQVRGEKLAPRAKLSILVGYEGSSIYRVFIPGRNMITRLSSVTFDESFDFKDSYEVDINSKKGYISEEEEEP